MMDAVHAGPMATATTARSQMTATRQSRLGQGQHFQAANCCYDGVGGSSGTTAPSAMFALAGILSSLSTPPRWSLPVMRGKGACLSHVFAWRMHVSPASPAIPPILPAASAPLVPAAHSPVMVTFCANTNDPSNLNVSRAAGWRLLSHAADMQLNEVHQTDICQLPRCPVHRLHACRLRLWSSSGELSWIAPPNSSASADVENVRVAHCCPATCASPSPGLQL